MASMAMASLGRRKARSAFRTCVHWVHRISRVVKVTAVSTRRISRQAARTPCWVMVNGPSAAIGVPGVVTIAGSAITPVNAQNHQPHAHSQGLDADARSQSQAMPTASSAAMTAIFRESVTASTSENRPSTRTRGSRDCNRPGWRAVCSEVMARAMAREKPIMVDSSRRPLMRNIPFVAGLAASGAE